MITSQNPTETIFTIQPVELGKILATHLGITQSEANMRMYYRDGALDCIVIRVNTSPVIPIGNVTSNNPRPLAEALLNCLMQCGKNGKMTLEDGGMSSTRTQDGTVVFGGHLIFKNKG